MSAQTPYTYYVYHKPTGLKYYGSKYAKNSNPSLFWKKDGYFTSSVKIHKLIQEYGTDSFFASVRKKFKTPQEALDYEYRFLKKVNALKKSDWLNKNMGGKKFSNYGPASEKALLSQKNKKQTKESNIKRSLTLKNRKKSEETKLLMSLGQLSRPKEQEEIRRNKIRSKAIGRLHSDITKQKLSILVANTKWINDGVYHKKVNKEDLNSYLNLGWKQGRILEKVICPHCNISGAKHNLVRYHFDRCKNKDDE